MAMKRKAAPPPAEDAASTEEQSGGGRKKLVLLALPLLALVAGWFFLLGPGAGGDAAEAAPEPPELGEVLELEPITMNLADGRLLKVGLALQVVASPSSGHEVTGAIALDEAISYLGEHSYAQLADPAARQVTKDELSHRVAERYHHDVVEVLFTEFVMQ